MVCDLSALSCLGALSVLLCFFAAVSVALGFFFLGVFHVKHRSIAPDLMRIIEGAVSDAIFLLVFR
jgi:formate/nitrite transporter FocA (FNT family)